MNKHTRLVVSVLFIVIIVLAVAITRFYSNSAKSTDTGDTYPVIEEKLDTDNEGNRIFRGGPELYGVIDLRERVIVSPEWQKLSFAGKNTCIASKRIRGKNLFGCIDYEGNIIVPFVYSSISPVKVGGQTFYSANTFDKNTIVLYDENFIPCLSGTWTSLNASSNELLLTSDNGSYTFSAGEHGLTFKEARLKGSCMNFPYELKVTSRVLLSKLSVSMLEQMASGVSRYIEYAYTGNSKVLAGMNTDKSSVFLTIFPEEHSITSAKLMGISDLFVYSAKSAGENPRYAVSVTADTSISYKENGKSRRLRDKYKAVVEFELFPSGEFKAVSGSFIQDKPDYPAPEPSTSGAAPDSTAERN